MVRVCVLLLLTLVLLIGCGGPGEADLHGKITRLDTEGQRVLFIDTEGSEDRAHPKAVWASFTEDIEITRGDKPVSVQDLQIGQRVEAWSKGPMMESYPLQTSVLKLNIIRGAENSADVTGNIEAKRSYDGPEGEQGDSVLTVNDQEILLTSTTVTPQHSTIQEWGVGEKVRIWLLGYGEEKRATKIERVSED